MDHRPFAVLAYPDGDRLHDPSAVRGPVAGLHVHVEAVQAVGAVVAVLAPGTRRDHGPPADAAGEAVMAWMGLVVAFFKGFSLVFSVQMDIPPKSCHKTSFWEACRYLADTQTSRSARNHRTIVFHRLSP